MDSNLIRDPWEDDEMFSARQKVRSKINFSRMVTYRTDAVLVRSYKPACAGTVTENKGRIGGKPSRRSLQNLVFLLNNCDTPMQSMLTVTMADQVSRRNAVTFHRQTLKLALQRLRDTGVNQYCWVREFQRNGSVHWHIFTDRRVSKTSGRCNKHLSRSWSLWMANRYKRSGWCSEECFRKMTSDSNDGFVGCCRFEQLHGDIGGRYAGKEGSKRFQKLAPKRWRTGGAWWRASRNVKCTPTGEKTIHGRYLEKAMVKINGVEREVPHRIQFNKGMR